MHLHTAICTGPRPEDGSLPEVGAVRSKQTDDAAVVPVVD